MSTVKLPLAISIYDSKGDEWEFIYANVSVSVFQQSIIPSVTRGKGRINYFRFILHRPYDLTGSQIVFFNFKNKNTSQIEVVYRNIVYQYILTGSVAPVPISISGLKGWWQPLQSNTLVLVDRSLEANHMFLLERRTYSDSYNNAASIFVKKISDRIQMVRAASFQRVSSDDFTTGSNRNYKLCFFTNSTTFLSREYTAFVAFSPGKHDPVIVVSGTPTRGGLGYTPISTSAFNLTPGNIATLLAINSCRLKIYSSVADKMQTASLGILFTYYPIASSSTFLAEYSGDDEDYYYQSDLQRTHPVLFGAPPAKYYVPGITILYNTASTQLSGLQLIGVHLEYRPNLSLYEREITLSEATFADIPSVFAYRIRQDSNGYISYSVTINREAPIWYTYSQPLPPIDLSDPVFTNFRSEAGVATGPIIEHLYDYQIPDAGNNYAMYRIGCGDILFYEALLFTRALLDAEYIQVRDYLLNKYRFGV